MPRTQPGEVSLVDLGLVAYDDAPQIYGSRLKAAKSD